MMTSADDGEWPAAGSGELAALQWLLRVSHLAGPDDLPAMASRSGAQLGAVLSVLFVIDYDQVVLVALTDPPSDAPTDPPTSAERLVQSVQVEGTLAGRAYIDVAQQVRRSAEVTAVWTPLIDGTDRLGVVLHEFPAGTAVDDDLQAACADVAALLAELILTRGLYGDRVEQARRRVGLSVPAEMQWTLLPPLTFVSRRLAVAGVVAPTARVAGDAFDYAVNDGTAHVAILDAMGHGLEAALLSNVAVATMRNFRRAGRGLVDSVRAMDEALGAQFGRGKFVTAVVAQLDLATGWLRWVTCGHPPMLLLRGSRVVKTLSDPVVPPIGLGLLPPELAVGEERLQPGDRLVLYTDGVVEARGPDGDFFGVDRLVDFVSRQASSQRPVAESLRRLNGAVLDYQHGQLQDDATTVLVEWLPERVTDNVPTTSNDSPQRHE